eukprot:scaffold145542_cov46-Attheya_sp.AAC.2
MSKDAAIQYDTRVTAKQWQWPPPVGLDQIKMEASKLESSPEFELSFEYESEKEGDTSISTTCTFTMPLSAPGTTATRQPAAPAEALLHFLASLVERCSSVPGLHPPHESA